MLQTIILLSIVAFIALAYLCKPKEPTNKPELTPATFEMEYDHGALTDALYSIYEAGSTAIRNRQCWNASDLKDMLTLINNTDLYRYAAVRSVTNDYVILEVVIFSSFILHDNDTIRFRFLLPIYLVKSTNMITVMQYDDHDIERIIKILAPIQRKQKINNLL